MYDVRIFQSARHKMPNEIQNDKRYVDKPHTISIQAQDNLTGENQRSFGDFSQPIYFSFSSEKGCMLEITY